MNPVIVTSRLTPQERLSVYREIKQSPDMTGYSTDELQTTSNVFKVYVNGDFAGSCFNIEFGDWVELGGYIILNKYRGLGLSKLLFEAAYKAARDSGKNIYVVTRNPAMKKVIAKYDFKTMSRFSALPRQIMVYELKMFLNLFRISEAIRKLFILKKSGKLNYYLKYTD